MSSSIARPIVILGTGELAELAHFYFTQDAGRIVVGFTVSEKHLSGNRHLGLPVVGYETVESCYPPEHHDLFVAVGYSRLNSAREQLCIDAKNRGYRLASYLSTRAISWPGLVLGDNCMIMEGNIIQPFVTIGDGVIIFSSSVVGHHVSISDYAFVGSEATLCGGSAIGKRSFIGVNSTIREHVRIGSDCIVGAGSLILKDTLDGSSYLTSGTTASGIPSSRLRSLL